MAKSKPAAAAPLPEMRAFIASEGVSRDSGQGKTSLHSIFDTIWTDGFPAIFRPFFLYAKVVGSTKKHKISLQAYGPDGKQIGKEASIKATFSEAGYADVVIQIGPMPLLAPGKIVFKLFADGRQIGWPCEITLRKGKPKRKAK